MIKFVQKRAVLSLKKTLIILLVLTLGCVFLSTSRNRHTIIIYSSMEQFRNDALQNQLNERFPDLNIYVMYHSTAKAAARISVEGEKTDADIVVGLESSYFEKIKDYFEDNTGLSTIPYLTDCLVEHHRYVTWERSGGSFIVNTKILKQKGLPIPHTYQDLLDPQYQGLIAMPDPKSSSTGYFYYLSLVNAYGEKEALAYFDQLAKNIKSFTESGSGPVKLLMQGEIAIALGMTFQGITEMNHGYPFELIEPDLGSPYTMSGTGLVKGRADNPEIKAVYQFIINDFIRYDKEYFNPGQIYQGQICRLENYPQAVHFSHMEHIDDIQEKERLLALWKY